MEGFRRDDGHDVHRINFHLFVDDTEADLESVDDRNATRWMALAITILLASLAGWAALLAWCLGK